MRFQQKILIATIILLTWGNLPDAFANEAIIEEGKTLFRARCAACHSIGKGKLVGPDLINVHDIRQENWLIQFIRSSQTLIKSGDALANEVFNQFNKIVMPDNVDLSDDNIRTIIAFIEWESLAAKKDVKETVVMTTGTGSGREPEPSILSFLEGGPSVSPLVFQVLFWLGAATIIAAVVAIGFLISAISSFPPKK